MILPENRGVRPISINPYKILETFQYVNWPKNRVFLGYFRSQRPSTSAKWFKTPPILQINHLRIFLNYLECPFDHPFFRPVGKVEMISLKQPKIRNYEGLYQHLFPRSVLEIIEHIYSDDLRSSEPIQSSSLFHHGQNKARKSRYFNFTKKS